jgi:hypothetical protein
MLFNMNGNLQTWRSGPPCPAVDSLSGIPV